MRAVISKPRSFFLFYLTYRSSPASLPAYRRAVPPSNLFSISSILSPISSFFLDLPAPGYVGKKNNQQFQSGDRFQFRADVRHVLNFDHH